LTPKKSLPESTMSEQFMLLAEGKVPREILTTSTSSAITVTGPGQASVKYTARSGEGDVLRDGDDEPDADAVSVGEHTTGRALDSRTNAPCLGWWAELWV
jgi:hypothetical protein